MSNLVPDGIPLPPQSKEAEEALVAAALLNPTALDTIGFLSEQDFYFGTPRTIWAAMQKLRDTKTNIDYLTVMNSLEGSGELEGIGGPASLAALISNVPSLNIDAFAKIIKDKAQRRSLLAQANQLAKIAYNEAVPVAEPLSGVLDDIVNAAQSTDKGALHIASGLTELVDFVNMRRQDPRKVWGVPTGFIDFDEFTGGQHSGLVTYIAGAPGSGKTKLCLQMGVQAALPNNGSNPVAIYSMEMPQIEIVKRIVSGREDVSTWDMNTGHMDDTTYEKFLGNVETLEHLPLYISDRSLTLSELHSDLTRLKKKYGIKLFVLDYLMLMSGHEEMDETPRSSYLSRGLKIIAQSVGVAGIAVSSTTKEIIASTATPTMRDMRGSAQVLFDADGVVFLQLSQVPEEANIAYLHWVKFPRTVNRSAGASTIALIVDGTYPIFRDATTRVVDLRDIK